MCSLEVLLFFFSLWVLLTNHFLTDFSFRFVLRLKSLMSSSVGLGFLIKKLLKISRCHNFDLKVPISFRDRWPSFVAAVFKWLEEIWPNCVFETLSVLLQSLWIAGVKEEAKIDTNLSSAERPPETVFESEK